MKERFRLRGGRAIIGALTVCFVTGIGFVILISSLLSSEVLPESSMDICVYLALVLSAFFGALPAARGGDTRIAIRIAAVGIVYGLILFAVGILVLDGSVNYLLRNLLCILIGCVVACAICIRKGKSKRGRRKPIR